MRCPGCQHDFGVTRDGALLAPGPEPADAASTEVEAPQRLAADLLVALEARAPGALQQAASDGRLFTLHGPALLEAYDEFRRRQGAAARSEVFREAVLARYGVDLFPVGTQH